MVRLVMEPAGLRIKRFVHPLPTLSLGARVGSGGGGAVMRLLRGRGAGIVRTRRPLGISHFKGGASRIPSRLDVESARDRRTSKKDTTMSGLSKRGPRRPPGGRVLLFSYIRSCNKHRISRYSSSAPRGRTESKQIKTFD